MDSGQIFFQGRPVCFHSPEDAQALGVHIVQKHGKIVDALSISENIFLLRQQQFMIPRQQNSEQTKRLEHMVGLYRSPDTPAADLSGPEKSLVELAGALSACLLYTSHVLANCVNLRIRTQKAEHASRPDGIADHLVKPVSIRNFKVFTILPGASDVDRVDYKISVRKHFPAFARRLNRHFFPGLAAKLNCNLLHHLKLLDVYKRQGKPPLPSRVRARLHERFGMHD